MVKRLIIAVILFVLILAGLKAFDLWQYGQQYKQIFTAFVKYEKITLKENVVNDVWEKRLVLLGTKDAVRFNWVTNKAKTITAQLISLQKSVGAVRLSGRYDKLAVAKRDLLKIIDYDIAWLKIVSRVDNKTGRLSSDRLLNKYKSTYEKSILAEEALIETLGENIPNPDLDRSREKLNKIYDAK